MKRAPVKPIQLKPEQIHEIQQAVFQLAEGMLDACYFLVDVAYEKEMGYWYLRVYVDLKEGGIAIHECEQISRLLEPAIEALPQLAELSYNLEVSSPGLFRPIKTVREFTFYAQKPVRVTGLPELKNAKKAAKTLLNDLPTVAEGLLQSFDESRQMVSLKSAADEKVFEVSLAENRTVYLNPVIRTPEEDAEEESDAFSDEDDEAV